MLSSSTSGGADAFPVGLVDVDELDLPEVRSMLEKLVERRLLAALSAEDQLLWSGLIEREQQLLELR